MKSTSDQGKDAPGVSATEGFVQLIMELRQKIAKAATRLQSKQKPQDSISLFLWTI
jgi:hypothetical protein